MTNTTATIDDLTLLLEVVEAGGYSAASARGKVSKSRLSRRIARLELQVGAVLIKRDSRHFEVTEVGEQVLEYARTIRDSATKAFDVVSDKRGVPSGSLSVACPVAMATVLLAKFASEFLQKYPLVKLSVTTTTGMVESLAERHDIVIHPSSVPLADTNMVARRLQLSRFMLVCAPDRAPYIEDPNQLSDVDVIGWDYMDSKGQWHLVHTDGRNVQVSVKPRFCSDNLLVIREAALAGYGVAPMSELLCGEDLATQRLKVVAPGWGPPSAMLYAIYRSRLTLSVAGRTFIEEFERFLKDVYLAI